MNRKKQKKKLIIYISLFILIEIFTYKLFSTSNFVKNVKIFNITENSATISWKTIKKCIGQLNYGTSPNSLFTVAMDVNMSTNHTIRLQKLEKGILYYFRIIYQYKNKTYMTKIYQFKTKGIPKPNIINLKIEKISPTKINLKYLFTTPSKFILNYIAQHSKQKNIIRNYNYIQKGTLTLTNLIPDTTYFYNIQLENKNGEKFKSKVFHFKTMELNLALNKPVYGTFTHLPDDRFVTKTKNPLQRITDGVLSYFSGLAQSGNIEKEDQYIIIDLEKKFKIKEIKIYWRALACSKNYSVYISKDKVKWEKIADKLNAKKGFNLTGVRGTPIKLNTVSIKSKTARYIKIFIPKNSPYFVKHKKWKFVQLIEVKVLGIL